MITGDITAVSPEKLMPGQPLKINVGLWAKTDNWALAIPGAVWATKVTAEIALGPSDSNTQLYSTSGLYVARPAEELSLGTMPNAGVNIIVTLFGNENPPFGSWQQITQKRFLVMPDASRIAPVPPQALLPGTPFTPPPSTVAPGYTSPTAPGTPSTGTPGTPAGSGTGFFDSTLFSEWMKKNQTTLIIAGIGLVAALVLWPDGKSSAPSVVIVDGKRTSKK